MFSNMNNEPDSSAWTVEELKVELDRYEAELLVADRPRNTITSYVYPVDRFLTWLSRPYRPIRAVRGPVPNPGISRAVVMGPGGSDVSAEGNDFDTASVMESRGRSRYDGLRTYLSGRSEPQIRLSFSEIERIIGQPLPSSARRHRAWWANERSGSHVHARSRHEANPPRRTAKVDLNAESADFVI
jgi:hypothetical protein